MHSTQTKTIEPKRERQFNDSSEHHKLSLYKLPETSQDCNNNTKQKQPNNSTKGGWGGSTKVQLVDTVYVQSLHLLGLVAWLLVVDPVADDAAS